MLTAVQTINAYLSDYVLVFLLVAVGLWYTVKTRCVQIRCLGAGLKDVFGGMSLNGGRHGGWPRPSRLRWVPVPSWAAAAPF